MQPIAEEKIQCPGDAENSIRISKMKELGMYVNVPCLDTSVTICEFGTWEMCVVFLTVFVWRVGTLHIISS